MLVAACILALEDVLEVLLWPLLADAHVLNVPFLFDEGFNVIVFSNISCSNTTLLFFTLSSNILIWFISLVYILIPWNVPCASLVEEPDTGRVLVTNEELFKTVKYTEGTDLTIILWSQSISSTV